MLLFVYYLQIPKRGTTELEERRTTHNARATHPPELASADIDGSWTEEERC